MTSTTTPSGQSLYLEPNQTRSAPPTEFENRLGDAIEAAYAAGVHDLDGLVARLAADGPQHPDGNPWTATSFTELIAELGR